MPERSVAARLRALVEGGVEFIVVGGVAAVLNGASVDTFDVDIVHSRDSADVNRLLAVLDSLDAISRLEPERRLKPNATHLSGTGHVNLITRYGPLDVLWTIGQNLAYEDLLAHSLQMEIGGGVQVRVLDLETLIAVKETIDGEKDRAVLPILLRTLEESKKRNQ